MVAKVGVTKIKNEDTGEEMVEFIGYIVLSLKTKVVRVVKTEPSRLNPLNVVVKYNVQVSKPTQEPIPEFKAKVTLTKAQVREMFVDSI